MEIGFFICLVLKSYVKTFSMDRIKYTCLSPVYIAEMLGRKGSDASIYEAFTNDEFVIQ